MSFLDVTDPDAVRSALREFDELGRESFLSKYGFGQARHYFLHENDRLYDSKAIVGAAHGYQFPDLGPLTPEEFSGGESTVRKKLEELGFDVVRVDAPKQLANEAESEGNVGGIKIREGLERILADYVQARTSSTLSGEHDMAQVFRGLERALRQSSEVKDHDSIRVVTGYGKGNWARVPWIAFLGVHRGVRQRVQQGVYVVYLFRQDMSGVYLTFNQGVAELNKQHGRSEARRILRDRARTLRQSLAEYLTGCGLTVDDGIDLRASGGLAVDFEHSTVAYKLYERNALPSEEGLLTDLDCILGAYEHFLDSEIDLRDRATAASEISVQELEEEEEEEIAVSRFERSTAVSDLIGYIEGRGFIFEPWHIAQYVTALRTKPFVILAGITGTGKSRLPALVADGTGCAKQLVPVRPDWTDSADVLGYVDLQGRFRAGRVLEVIRDAIDQDDRYWVCIIDEMNLARVEQYFAEVLSHIEDRSAAKTGGFRSETLLSQQLAQADVEWANVYLPPNLGLVGTVNMDETTHGFSRKVLDRAFTIELSDIDLTRWKPRELDRPRPKVWPVRAWYPRAAMISELTDLGGDDLSLVQGVIDTLTEVNQYLTQAQLQVGYRTRDEIVLFNLHAEEIRSAFRTRAGDDVHPLDLSLQMKILPRIVGGSGAVRSAVLQLLGWAKANTPFASPEDARSTLEEWQASGRPAAIKDAPCPRTAARLCLMWERFLAEGYTSFWL